MITIPIEITIPADELDGFVSQMLAEMKADTEHRIAEENERMLSLCAPWYWEMRGTNLEANR